jgi:hypothetical protein
MIIFKIGSRKLFAQAGFNLDPPDLCLLSSQDYRCESLVPSGLWIFLMVLECELRALHLLGRYSTTGATLPALFALVIFQIGFHAFWP